MSPEQVARAGCRSRERYLLVGLVGKMAFEGKSSASVIAAILERPTPSVADVTPALDRMLGKCLEKDGARWSRSRIRAPVGAMRVGARTAALSWAAQLRRACRGFHPPVTVGGSGQEQGLTQEPGLLHFPLDWSRDGQYIIEQVVDPKTKLEFGWCPYPVIGSLLLI